VRRSALALTGLAVVAAVAANVGAQSTSLRAGAAISGHVLDEFGDPAVNVQVIAEAQAPRARPGTPPSAIVARTVSDDRGEYRLAGLPSGLVIVSVLHFSGATMIVPAGQSMPVLIGAVPRPDRIFYPGTLIRSEATPLEVAAEAEHDRIDFVLPAPRPSLPPVAAARVAQSGPPPPDPTATASIMGRVSSPTGRAIGRAQVQLLPAIDPIRSRVTVTDADGQFAFRDLAAGKFRLVAAKAGFAGVEVANAESPAVSDATPRSSRDVEIGIGETRDHIDLTLRAWSAVSGRVVDEAGVPLQGASVQLLAVEFTAGRRRLLPSTRSSSIVGVGLGARLQNDGAFEFPNVPPGQYIVRADRGRSHAREGEFGVTPVVVNGTDVSGVIVRTSAGSSITGQIRFERYNNTPLPAVSAIELSALPVDYDQAPATQATADVHADWTFELHGINGPRRLELMRPMDGWALKEIVRAEPT